MGFGRNGERVANTPMRRLPPSRGGLTVGLQSSRMLSENCHKIQRWEYSSSPRNASLLRYSGANSILPVNSRTSPLCLGAPNFSGKSVRTQPIIFICSITSPHSSALTVPQAAAHHRQCCPVLRKSCSLQVTPG